MTIKRSTWIWLVTVMIIIVIVAFQFFQLDNAKDIPGGFEKVAYVRNENNQGGIYQYYAYTVSDTSVADYTTLVEMIPFHGKAGETTVYFFDRNQPFPEELNLEVPNFDITQYRPVAILVRTKKGVRKESIVD